MVVHPGDLVLGDGDGLLAVPAAEAAAIADRVEAIQRDEADVLAAIAAGRADRSWVARTLAAKGVL
jgi:regulator of RNase E activity RraA